MVINKRRYFVVTRVATVTFSKIREKDLEETEGTYYDYNDDSQIMIVIIVIMVKVFKIMIKTFIRKIMII